VEIHRFGLQKQLTRLVEDSGIPVAATLLGKSIISEMHPQYLGVYEGGMGEEKMRRAVESADCLLILGAFMTDVNLGIYTARLDESRAINATSEQITIKHHHYEDIQLADFITELTRSVSANQSRRRALSKPGTGASKQTKPFKLQQDKPCTVRRFFERINEFIDEDYIVICDIGDSLFGAAELTIHRKTEFISPAFYTSMGFAVPAAIGTQINRKNLRPLVFVGDGAFQMTGMELSTIARYGLNPIIFVLNNKGYTTERFIREGPYNDIHEWAYHLVPQILQKGWGCEVRTEGELEEALSTARSNVNSFSLINIHLDKLDHSKALKRLGSRLGKKTTIK
jgi:indolepyruvate decarboxylase